MMNGKIRRLLAGLMCLVMVVGLLPATAGAGFVTDEGSIVLEYVGDSYTVPANTAPVYSSSNLKCVYTAGGAVSSITDGNYYLGDGTNYISSDMGVTDDINVAALWTVSTSGNGYTIKLGEKYLAYDTPDSGSAEAILGLSDSSFEWQWNSECNAFFYQASPFEAPGYIYADGSIWDLTESVDAIATAYTSGSCTMTYVQGVESQTGVEVTVGNTVYNVILAAAVSETSLTMGTKPDDGTTTGEPFPQGTGGSNSFRIPAMVTLSDGTIVAAADARWNTTYDGGGLDTIVARSSDNGANWNYTFANYLGDNDNKYNGSSTCFIDPALAVKTINGVETIFMLVDLYPYGVALNGDQELPPVTDTGFNSNGKLLLSADSHSSYRYYLDKNADGTYTIYSSNGSAVDGYTVDEYFNITGTDGTSSNLFFSDSPYKVVRTGFLYLTKSTDGGETWSAPELLNLKFSDDSERVCLVGPGRGLVTSTGTIVFPVYTFNSNASEITTNQQTGFIYSTDNGTNWTRSASLPTNSQISWSSESAVVELTDGTLRFFFRNGTTNLCYVDYDNGWGTPVVMSGVDTNSNCQISAITYSKTVDGKQVILVSCPTGPSGEGSDQSGASYRKNGKIFAFTVESDNTLASIGSISVTSNDAQFMYSCLTEQKDSNGNETGVISILYEDKENAWGTGTNCYYTMSYATYDFATALDVTFDSTTSGGGTTTGSTELTDEEANVTVTTESAVLTDVAVTAGTAQAVENADGTKTVSKTWSISVNGGAYTGAATVKIPYDSAFDGCTSFTGYMGDGADANDAVTVRLEDGYFVCDVLHFSDLTITGSSSATQTVTLKVGETFTVTDETGNYENLDTNVNPDTSVATMSVTGVEGNPETTVSTTKATELEDGATYIIRVYNTSYALSTNSGRSDWGTNTLAFESNTLTANEDHMWTLEAVDGGYKIKSADGYLNLGTDNNAAYLNATGEVFTITNTDTGWTIGNQSGRYINALGGLTAYYSAGGWTGDGTRFDLYKVTTASDASTAITFTGVAPGTTTAKVGNTTYNITVSKKTETAGVAVGGSITISGAGNTIERNSKESVATATISDGTLTVTGVAEGTTVITTDYGVYTITVYDGTPISIKDGETSEIEVTLEDGQYVVWTTSDSSYVGVAGVYDSTEGAYTDAAIIAGQNVTTSPVLVTGTVYNANGTVDGTYKWLVTVTEGTADSNTTTKYIYVNIDKIENCTVYYSINGGELIEVNGEGILVNQSVTGKYAILFFAAPDEGYALTYMSSTNSAGLYYTLSDGNPDGTGSGAWPFDSVAQSTIPTDSGDAAWVEGHGIRWALLEGNMTIEQMKILYSNALALGCDGVLNFTKNNTGTTNGSTTNFGDNDLVTDLSFVAQKLPEMEKNIASVTRGSTGANKTGVSEGTPVTYYDGISVYIGDTINYAVTVYVPTANSTYGTIDYSAITLKDETLKITALDGAASWTSVSSGVSEPTATTVGSFDYILNGETVTYSGSTTAYTYTATLELTTENFTSYVKGGKITNTASLAYTYQAEYSTGSISASSTAVAAVSVEPAFVVDFGLPIDMDLSDMVTSYGKIESITREDNNADVYGSFSWDAANSVLTYTPTSVMLDTVDLLVTLDDGGKYYLAIHPASNVLYEETFMNISDSDHYTDWTQPTTYTFKTITVKDANNNDFNIYIDEGGDGKQTAANKAPYGYDAEYVNSTGVSGRSYKAELTEAGQMTENLVVDFYGNCFDLIGTCGPTTGYVYLAIKANDAGGSNQVIIIDTSNSDGTYYQVPLAHVDLTLGNYTAYVFGGYRQVDTNGMSFFGMGGMGASDDLFAMFDRAYEEGLDFGDVQFVYFDESSALASYANSMMMYAADNTGENSNETQTVKKQAGGIIEIDGFRVYGKSDNGAFAVGEYDVKYVNVLEQSNNGFMGYIEGGTGSYGNGNYEDEGGPQNEIYLTAGSSVTFNVNSNITYAQISARAVSGTTTMQSGTSDTYSITSNTEMYYDVEIQNGTITITNKGDKLLALGNLKLTTENRGYGVTASELTLLSVPTEETYATAFMMLRAYSGEEETETPEEDTGNTEETETPEENNGEEETDVPVIIWPTYTPSQTNVFQPEEFDMEVDSYTLFGQRFVTIKVNASTDVAKLTINGTPLWAANYIWVKQGLADEYVYTMLLIVPENEAAFFEVLAYNEDGLASKVYTVTD